MKHRLVLLIAAIALSLAGCVKIEKIDDLNSQLDAIEGTQIATIESQISSINSTLEALKQTQTEIQSYADALKKEKDALALTQSDQSGQVTALQEKIDELEAADEALQQKIADLDKYVKEQLSKQEDWAKATFATISQFDALATVLAGLESDIKACEDIIAGLDAKITAAYKKAIDDAMSESVSKMKKWVNEALAADYWTIAQTDAELSSLEKKLTAADAELKKEVEAQKAAIAKAKEDLTAAYTEAISTAITELEGKLDQKLAEDVKTAQDALQEQIDTITEAITALEERLDALEESLDAIINSIQSISVIPTHSDGSVGVCCVSGNVDTIRFEVRPSNIITEENKSNFTYKLKVIQTQTKATQIEVGTKEVPSDSVSIADGVLELRVNTDEIASYFTTGGLSASLILESVGTDKTSRSSAYFSLYIVPPVKMATGKYTFKAFFNGNCENVELYFKPGTKQSYFLKDFTQSYGSDFEFEFEWVSATDSLIIACPQLMASDTAYGSIYYGEVLDFCNYVYGSSAPAAISYYEANGLQINSIAGTSKYDKDTKTFSFALSYYATAGYFRTGVETYQIDPATKAARKMSSSDIQWVKAAEWPIAPIERDPNRDFDISVPASPAL